MEEWEVVGDGRVGGGEEMEEWEVARRWKSGRWRGDGRVGGGEEMEEWEVARRWKSGRWRGDGRVGGGEEMEEWRTWLMRALKNALVIDCTLVVLFST